jgi:hypothetical protein
VGKDPLRVGHPSAFDDLSFRDRVQFLDNPHRHVAGCRGHPDRPPPAFDFWDIGPTFVEKAEARFQNRYAADIYSIPVTFDAKPTLVPGFSRLTAIRADNSQAIGAWALRFNHGRQVA